MNNNNSSAHGSAGGFGGAVTMYSNVVNCERLNTHQAENRRYMIEESTPLNF